MQLRSRDTVNLSEQEETFATIVSRLDDPEDRIDRRGTPAACVLGLFGALLALVAVGADWSLWVGVVGLSALAAADMIGGVILKRWLGRPRLAASP